MRNRLNLKIIPAIKNRAYKRLYFYIIKILLISRIRIAIEGSLTTRQRFIYQKNPIHVRLRIEAVPLIERGRLVL